MGTKVNLFGASGHCKVIIDILLANNFEIGDIVDDNPKTETLLQYKVQKNENSVFKSDSNWIISIGNNGIRKKISATVHVKYIKVIHPFAQISSFVKIGEGTVVMPGVVVNPDVSIGKHCIINTGAIIEHDVKIEDFVHICPGVALAGDVKVGEGSQIGIGATVIQGVKIGKWAMIGAGAVIIKDVPDYSTVVGNPGRIIKTGKENE